MNNNWKQIIGDLEIQLRQSPLVDHAILDQLMSNQFALDAWPKILNKLGADAVRYTFQKSAIYLSVVTASPTYTEINKDAQSVVASIDSTISRLKASKLNLVMKIYTQAIGGPKPFDLIEALKRNKGLALQQVDEAENNRGYHFSTPKALRRMYCIELRRSLKSLYNKPCHGIVADLASAVFPELDPLTYKDVKDMKPQKKR
jgi:hypothetical protein